MNSIAQREVDNRIRQHQIERQRRLKDIEALAAVGRVPTFRDYVMYHCFMFLLCREALPYEEWRENCGRLV